MEKKFYLYGLYSPYSDDIKYIGITTGKLTTRLMGHLRQPTNPFIKLWFDELKDQGRSPIINLITEFNTYEDLLAGEINEISKYKNMGISLFNMTEGGDINPMYGKTHTIESRLKISNNNKGLKRTDEQKKEREKLLKQLWSDKNWSDRTKQKMKGNKNSLGHKHSEESKLLMSTTHKKMEYSIGNSFFSGHKHSDLTKMLMSKNNSGENNPMFGKKLSTESLAKRSNTVKMLGIYCGENNPNFKFKITKEDLINFYINQDLRIKDIAKIYGCCNGVIKNNLKKYEIKKQQRNKYCLNITNIIELKESGMNLIEIGNMYGCNNKIISKFLKKYKNGK